MRLGADGSGLDERDDQAAGGTLQPARLQRHDEGDGRALPGIPADIELRHGWRRSERREVVG